MSTIGSRVKYSYTESCLNSVERLRKSIRDKHVESDTFVSRDFTPGTRSSDHIINRRVSSGRHTGACLMNFKDTKSKE